jgi:hypothetical protein
MLDHGAVGVNTAKTLQTQAETEIDILEIAEETFVEPANFQQRRAPEQRRRATAEKTSL